jgi:hypothetical protein
MNKQKREKQKKKFSVQYYESDGALFSLNKNLIHQIVSLLNHDIDIILSDTVFGV